jgi:ABC-type nickel/cobalt efflux system permease component RcnA
MHQRKSNMPLLEIALLLLVLVAMFVAWRAWRAIRALNAKLDRVAATLYETRREQREQDEEIQNRVVALDVALQQMTGELRFDPNISLARLFEMEPRASNVLAAFHIGGCASCAVDENATLAEAVRARGADLDRVLKALNTLPANGRAPDLRAPNVQLHL